MNPRYPIYIISKGRWESRQTVRALDKRRVSYKIVIEPQEYAQYSAVINPDKILILSFSNLGQGSIPARNWVWDHAVESGAERHWILDDNIRQFYQRVDGKRIYTTSGTTFKIIEDFVDRYKNVALSGMQYRGFVPDSRTFKPITFNSRIYSCILIKNDIPYRWRGRYNEDTDLSLQALNDGWCTVLFWAFIAGKAATMTMKGGNTDELYQGDGRLKMALELQRRWPQYVKVTRKWGRWQHQVDYRPFKKNKLILRDDIEIPEGVNNYGMKLVKVE